MSLPLPSCFGTCLAASEDPLFTTWNFSWITRSLVDGAGPLLDANLYFPYRRTLALGEPSLANALVAVPFIAWTGNPIVGHNVVVLLAFTLAGFGAYLLAWDLMGRRGPALLAGALFAASPFLLHSAHNVQTLSSYWLPYLVVATSRFRRAPTWGRAAVLWAVATGLVLSSIYYTLYGGLALVVYAVTGVVVCGHRWGWRHLGRLVAVAPPFLAVVAWSLWPYWVWAREFGIARRLEEVEIYSTELIHYVTVSPNNLLHRWLGLWAEGNLSSSAVFPGIVTGTLAVVGIVFVGRAVLRRSPPAAPWAREAAPHVAVLVAAVVLGFGPTLKLGTLSVALPYRLLFHFVPGFGGLRTPNRFAVLVALSVAVLAAVGLTLLADRVRSRAGRIALCTLLTLAIALEFATYPFPGTDNQYPGRYAARLPVVDWLLAQPRPTRVLDLPIGRPYQLLFAAAIHGQPMVNGWSSFAPPLYGDLVDELKAFPSEHILRLIATLPVDYVIVNERAYRPEAVAGLLNRPEVLTLDRRFPGFLVFRLAGGARPSRDLLRTELIVPPPTARSRRLRPVLRVSNPTEQDLPLYPLHTVVAAARLGDGKIASATGRLPLWLPPGGAVQLEFALRLPGQWPDTLRLRIAGRIDAVRDERSFEHEATIPRPAP